MSKKVSHPAAPCRECPWARKSARGWVGNIAPEEWVVIATREVTIPCHLAGPKGLLGGGGKQCAGAAIYRSNTGKRPRDPEIYHLPPDREVVFATPMEFVAHHRDGGVCSSDGRPVSPGLVVELAIDRLLARRRG